MFLYIIYFLSQIFFLWKKYFLNILTFHQCWIRQARYYGSTQYQYLLGMKIVWYVQKSIPVQHLLLVECHLSRINEFAKIYWLVIGPQLVQIHHHTKQPI
jgi:hypothetical protein